MTDDLDLEILGELAPGGLHYGMTCLVEFEPHSLWQEASLTITAEALKKGIKTEYHVFQHTPGDIRVALNEMGVDVVKYERKGVLRIMDSYTPTTPLRGRERSASLGYPYSGRVPDIREWNKTIREKIERGFDEDERRWLHVDDNEAVLLQYNSEEYVTDGWRTSFVPMTKARELLTLHALVTGVASDSFYRKRESLADAVIDFKVVEGRKLEHYIRLRALRGTQFDSRWRLIETFEKNRVRLSSGKQAFGFQSEESEKIFGYLLKAFVDDHFAERKPAEASGLRTLVEIAQGIGAAKTSLYSADGSASLRELARKGVVERRVLTGQRGRGGKVTRLRVAYEKEFVKEHVDRYMQK